MAFLELLFPENISYGAKGGPLFSVLVIGMESGREQRISKWEEALHQWDVAHALADRVLADQLVTFFYLAGGKANGFRFKDWRDCSSDVEDVATQHATEPITSQTFQLTKRYTRSGLTYSRTITKPISDVPGNAAATQDTSTVRLWHPGTGVEITSGWTVNCATGVVSFSIAPGYTPKATFGFHVPVRFDVNAMGMVQEGVTIRSWNNVPLLELRI